MKLLEVIELRHVYPGGVVALEGVNVAIEEGEKVAVVGQNGSGKTTLCRHFNGLLRPTSGKVLLKGVDTAGKTIGELSRTAGYVFQNPSHQLFCSTVWEEVQFGAKNIGLRGEELNTRVKDTLEFFGLARIGKKHPLSFSSGVRKLVALASVYAMRPRLLVLDEPTTGQDHWGREQVGHAVTKMAGDGCACVVVTHDMNFVATYTDRVVVMTEGKVIKEGSPREVFSDWESMKRAFIAPPQVSKLAHMLAGKGVSQRVLTPEELAEELVEKDVIS
ncbi:MAG: energy-coupling factor ABC transporter ATP-binding protein [Bacteroidota bacterium]